MNGGGSGGFDPVARSTVNAAWGALCMEVLARLGVRAVVVSPGSRSTPLAFAAARNPKLDAVPVLDERSAGFFALGLAKRTRVPVALVCTSGSAAANYFPTVVEASMSGTPLLVLTADRPPELRDCSSGQTIDQLKLYGGYVRGYTEVALPEASPDMLAYLRQTLVHATHRSLEGDPGPVHLNFPFRDPLAPGSGESVPVLSAQALEDAATVVTRPVGAVREAASPDAVAVERLASHRRGLIVAGFCEPAEDGAVFAETVGAVAAKLGWPVLADVLNPLREHASRVPGLVTHYDALLRGGGEGLAPTGILQIGAPPTSKVLRGWLRDLDASAFLLGERPVNTDPLHRVAAVLRGGVRKLAEMVPEQEGDAAWLDRWRAAEQGAALRVGQALDAADGLFEGRIAALLSRHLPEGTPVFFANSMPVRYAEFFWRAGDGGRPLYANRGANGIDGTLGTALGLAHGGVPTVALVGDLAFSHDANALLAAGELRGGLTVIVSNNGGGGIFENLPVADWEPPFERFFATPQTVDIGTLCQAHGVVYLRIDNMDTLIAAIRELPASGVRVLEVSTDRKADVRTLRRIQTGDAAD